eukprot:gnl/MRDRNA2_/MRDRNA2_115218_c0_seq1.p1 gnl/MRDRNA2_/MRDRNA2_115218_c0~~gnl/MRDRNA2_/MRDRNA2_115218_c0_seq1.p1  ORF type:complete len:408 (-),score=41.62 gnl/MRDRNA2_/MRDRNA2_115218_c0_seq1:183-1406(-)
MLARARKRCRGFVRSVNKYHYQEGELYTKCDFKCRCHSQSRRLQLVALGTECEMPGASCAICFESVNRTFSLPCECKVAYCMQCWDRCLAQSLNHCGQARCPTCRTPVHVDFDAEAGCLVFAREKVRALRDDILDRIRSKARPAQIKILQRHGEAHRFISEIVKDPHAQLCKRSIAELKKFITSTGGSVHGCVEKADLAKRLLELAREWEVAALCAAETDTAPACVCGSVLYRVHGSARARSQVEKLLARSGVLVGSQGYHQAYAQVMQQVTQELQSGVTCDICDDCVHVTSGVWTCKNDESTMFHATSYDICDRCFVSHACHSSDYVVKVRVPTSDISSGSRRISSRSSPWRFDVYYVQELREAHFRILMLGICSLVCCVAALISFRKFFSFQKLAQRLHEPLVQT